ncbi:hypothetical protein PoB_000791800 [Plakobranchus ocellatus]|uniref:Uncharacterized protein n=1 Tax=Plakobranchus ocellatus TaxID=259542 RepID=A0AAV3YH04_9GAST|nr:hypothetical protein PoB_000791800 [Plakobranchus ocellatus]
MALRELGGLSSKESPKEPRLGDGLSTEHHIQLMTSTPVEQRPYPVNDFYTCRTTPVSSYNDFYTCRTTSVSS